jgi:integrase
VDQGYHCETDKQTVEQFLGRWLENYAKSQVSARTFQRYKQIVEKQLNPAFGKKLLTKLNANTMQTAYTRWLKEGRLDKRPGGLSPKTILQHHRVLHHALKTAVLWRKVLYNTADGVKPPRVERREAKFLTQDECHKLLAAARQSALHLPVLLMMNCGLRRGEVLALRWSDVDLEKGRIVVRGAVGKDESERTQDQAAQER